MTPTGNGGSAGACAACKYAAETVFWRTKNGRRLLRCRRCGSIVSPAEGETERMKGLYDHYYDFARFTATRPVAASLARLVAEAEQFRRTGRWLDLGFGEGMLLTEAEKRGWQCYGVEISGRALEHARGRGWTVTVDPQIDSRFVTGGFDVVTMIELLEHVPQSRGEIRRAADWLRPGGWLYLTTPNARSLNRWLLGERWSVFSPPEHLTVWSAPALRGALGAFGFGRVRVRSEGLNPIEVIARFTRRGASNAQPDRNQAGIALNVALSGNLAGRVFKRVANQVLSLTGIGDTLKARATKTEA